MSILWFRLSSCPSPLRKGKIFTMEARNLSIFSFLSKNSALKAELVANSFPRDPDKQAYAYKLLLNVDPNRVIQRYESKKYAQNSTCTNFYLSALSQTGNLNRLSPLIERKQEIKSPATAPSDKKSTEKLNKPKSTRRSQPAFPLSSPLSAINFKLGTKDFPLVVKPIGPFAGNRNRGGIFRRLFSILSNMALIGAVGYLIFSYSNNQKFAGMSMKVHQFFKQDSTGKAVTFSDVQGCDEAKEELEEIVAFLKNPERFNKLGAHLPKGVLLVGPPGTGKTLLARAVAGEANVPFIYASGAEFDELFVGMGSLRIRQMFENAKEQAPAIIFIDEIDAIGSKRNPRDPQHARMSLNQLLVELDGFTEAKGVIVIGATNFPETLDKALLRPGRFDRHVYVPLPDVRGRMQILNLYLKDVPTDEQSKVDVSVLARGTPGFSGADLSKMVNQAKILASKQGHSSISMSILEAAKDEMLMGQERRSAVIEEKIRRLTAYHEGGHAIIALWTPYALPIHKATIMPRGQSLGLVSQLPDGDQLSLSKAELLSNLDVSMGGRMAEELIFGSENVTTGASSDFSNATKVARAMVSKYGMSEKVFFKSLCLDWPISDYL